jgi:hypothetical protein
MSSGFSNLLMGFEDSASIPLHLGNQSRWTELRPVMLVSSSTNHLVGLADHSKHDASTSAFPTRRSIMVPRASLSIVVAVIVLISTVVFVAGDWLGFSPHRNDPRFLELRASRNGHIPIPALIRSLLLYSLSLHSLR